MREDAFSIKILGAILNLFCLKFTPTSIRKRIHLIYFAVSIATEPYRRNIPMIEHKSVLDDTLAELYAVYKQVKKSEVSPQTDYLFAGLHDPNSTEKSLQKMELVNSIQFPDGNSVKTL